MNICFASGKNALKRIARQSIEGFDEVFAPPPDKIDVLVLSGDCDVSQFIDKNVEVCIFSNENADKVTALKKVKGIVSCGMDELDSVTFSSIGEESALVCIRRQIVFYDKKIEPCEFKTNFDVTHGIYHNLVVALLAYFAKE